MKYNDIAVTKSSWEELVRDSFGGYRNASAYCLMYINDKAQFLIQGKMMCRHHWHLEITFYLACMSILPECMQVHCVRTWCLSPEDRNCPRVRDGCCEPLCGCWKLNPQQMLSFASSPAV